MAQRFLIAVLVVEFLGRVVDGDLGIDLGIPGAVVDAVQDSSEFRGVDVEDALESMPQRGGADFVGVAGGDGGHEIGEDDAGFHEVQSGGVVVVLRAVGLHEERGIESDLAEDVLAGESLVTDVVDGVTDARMGHAVRFVELEEEEGDQTRFASRGNE